MNDKLWLRAFWIGFVAGGILTFIAMHNWINQ